MARARSEAVARMRHRCRSRRRPARSRPASTRSSVVLPAPLSPCTSSASPASTAKSSGPNTGCFVAREAQAACGEQRRGCGRVFGHGGSTVRPVGGRGGRGAAILPSRRSASSPQSGRLGAAYMRRRIALAALPRTGCPAARSGAPGRSNACTGRSITSQLGSRQLRSRRRRERGSDRCSRRWRAGTAGRHRRPGSSAVGAFGTERGFHARQQAEARRAREGGLEPSVRSGRCAAGATRHRIPSGIRRRR